SGSTDASGVGGTGGGGGGGNGFRVGRGPRGRAAGSVALMPRAVATCGTRDASFLTLASNSSLGFSGTDCGFTASRTGEKAVASRTAAQRSAAASAVSDALAPSV